MRRPRTVSRLEAIGLLCLGVLLLLLPSVVPSPVVGGERGAFVPAAPAGDPVSTAGPLAGAAVSPGVPSTAASGEPTSAFRWTAPTPGAAPGRPERTPAPSICQSCAFYFQEGVYFDGICLANLTVPCGTRPGLHTGAVEVTAEPGPYPWGEEFNGLSNTGDWYQSEVLFDWCGTGFGWGNEAFDAAGASVYPASGGVTCVPGVTIHAGDLVQIGLFFPTGGAQLGDACFFFDDVTGGSGGIESCIAQPDPGPTPDSNYFRWGSSGGFFTGLMTEYIDPNATACGTFRGLVPATYRTAPGGYVTQFTPFADEWDPGTNSTCFSTLGHVAAQNQTPGDAVASVVDISGGTSYGAHWVTAQNTSAGNAPTWWQMGTDATLPPPTVPWSASDAGEIASVTFLGPIRPYAVDGSTVAEGWVVPNGLGTCVPANQSASLACRLGSTPGQYPVSYDVTESSGAGITSQSLDYTIFPPMVVETPTARPSGVDAGQPLDLSVRVVNGSGPSLYNWTGLPPGCSAQRYLAAPHCSPSQAGTFDLFVLVTDSVGASDASPEVGLTVVADPLLAPLTAVPASGTVDAHQALLWQAVVTGGSGGTTFRWSGLPTGCSSGTGPSEECAPRGPGTGTVTVQAVDSNGFATSDQTKAYDVLPDPRVTTADGALQSAVGRPLALSVSVSGGQAPYSIRWSGLPVGCSSENATTLECAPAQVGTYLVNVTVVDSLGASNGTSETVTVHPAVSTGLFASSTNALPLLVASAGLVAAIVIALVLLRRRARGRSPPPSEPEAPAYEDASMARERESLDDPPPYGESG